MTTSRIKVVPNITPNADGEWIETPLDLSHIRRWRQMEALVAPYIPNGHHVVSVERGAKRDEITKLASDAADTSRVVNAN